MSTALHLALIPYFPQPHLDLGFASIYAWGVMVAFGFLVGSALAARGAQRDGLDPKVSYDYSLWVFVGGFAGAHLIHVFFYEPEMLERNPLNIFLIWEGVSSYGGFLGAAVTTFIFFRLRRKSFFHYADSLALGFALAWSIARAGCFMAHDHQGIHTDFFLAVDFPDGPRHDLGLYESIYMWCIFAVMLFVNRKRPGGGTLTGIMCVTYAPPRFFMEYLRAFDARYYGFTPAQYGSVVVLALGIWLLIRARNEEHPPYAESRATASAADAHPSTEPA